TTRRSSSSRTSAPRRLLTLPALGVPPGRSGPICWSTPAAPPIRSAPPPSPARCSAGYPPRDARSCVVLHRCPQSVRVQPGDIDLTAFTRSVRHDGLALLLNLDR